LFIKIIAGQNKDLEDSSKRKDSVEIGSIKSDMDRKEEI